jgi:adenosylmethionine-8-amino-7-oxononanoate aminotransferase
MLIDVEHVSPTYAYRDQSDEESAEQYGERLAQELQQTVDHIGGEHVIAFVAETVGGATSGALTPPPGYFKRVREICDRHGMLLILDEVMCGMGRTGTLHACEQEGIAPDLMAIAKGLGGGYQPVGAVLVGAKVIDAIGAGSGFFQHGHTYIGHPVACAAALAVQQVLARDKLVERCAQQGARLGVRLSEAFREHPHVGDIRGRGLFQAVELVADRATKQPFEPALKVHAKVKKAAMEAGMLCYPMGGTIDGARGDHVLLAPPFIISDEELDLLIGRLTEAVNTVVQAVSP